MSNSSSKEKFKKFKNRFKDAYTNGAFTKESPGKLFDLFSEKASKVIQQKFRNIHRNPISSVIGGAIGAYSQSDSERSAPVIAGTVIGIVAAGHMTFSEVVKLDRMKSSKVTKSAIDLTTSSRYDALGLESKFETSGPGKTVISFTERINRNRKMLEEARSRTGALTETQELYDKFIGSDANVRKTADLLKSSRTKKQEKDLGRYIEKTLNKRTTKMFNEILKESGGKEIEKPVVEDVIKYFSKRKKEEDRARRVFERIEKRVLRGEVEINSIFSNVESRLNTEFAQSLGETLRSADTPEEGLRKVAERLYNEKSDTKSQSALSELTLGIRTSSQPSSSRIVVPKSKIRIKEIVLSDLKEDELKKIKDVIAGFTGRTGEDLEETSKGMSKAIDRLVKYGEENNSRVVFKNGNISLVSKETDQATHRFPVVNIRTDKGRFSVSNSGKLFSLTSWNPFASQVDKTFDMSITGRAEGQVSIGGKELIKSFEPIEAVNFFDSLDDAESVSRSLLRFTASDNAAYSKLGITGLSNISGLAERIAQETELKHTLDKQLDSGMFSSRKVQEGVNRSEISKAVEAISAENPLLDFYGTGSANSITAINTKDKDFKISPIPNYSRGGQGVMNRGYVSTIGENMSQSYSGKEMETSSSVSFKKYVLQSEEFEKAIPYLFDLGFGSGDGSFTVNAKTHFGLVENGSFEIMKAEDGSIHLPVDKPFALRQAITNVADIGEVSSTSSDLYYWYWNEQDSKGKGLGGINNPSNFDEKGVYLTRMDNIGIGKNGEIITISPRFTDIKLTNIQDVGDTIRVDYEGQYRANRGGDLKLFSQSAKGAGGISDNFGLTVAIDHLIKEGEISLKMDEDFIELDISKMVNESEPVVVRRFIGSDESKNIELSKGREIDLSQLKEIIDGNSTQTSDSEIFEWNRVAQSKVNTVGVASKMLNDPNIGVYVSKAESAIEPLIDIQNAKTEDELRATYSKFFDKFYGSTAQESALANNRRLLNLISSPESFEVKKAEILGDSIYNTILSEDKSAPDLARTVQGATSSKYYSDDYAFSTSQAFSSDEAERLSTRKEIKERSVKFAANNSLNLLDVQAAVEFGSGVHGAGKTRNISWLMLDQLKTVGFTKEMIERVSNENISARHELEMFRRGGSSQTQNTMSIENAAQFKKIQGALTGEISGRKDIFSRLAEKGLISEFDQSSNFVTYNIKNENDIGLKSISFSLAPSSHSNIFIGEEGNIHISEVDKVKQKLFELDYTLSVVKNKNVKARVQREFDQTINKYEKLTRVALTGENSLIKQASARTAKESIVQVAYAATGIVADLAIPSLRAKEGETKAFISYSMNEFEKTMEEVYRNKMPEFEYEEVAKKGDQKVWRVRVKTEEGLSVPLIAMSGREPGMGAYSTMMKEVLVTSLQAERGIYEQNFVGISPSTKEWEFTDEAGNKHKAGGKSLESTYQFLDYDRDTTLQTFIAPKTKEEYDEFNTLKSKQEEYMKKHFDSDKEVSLKSRDKTILTADKIDDVADRTGASTQEVYTSELKKLGKKGGIRKTATPFVTSFELSLSASIDAAYKAGELSYEEMIAAKVKGHQLLENVIKTQHADTDKVTNGRLEVFEAIEQRMKFKNTEGGHKQYFTILEDILKSYVSVPSSANPEAQEITEKTLNTIIEAEKKHGLDSQEKVTALTVSAEINNRNPKNGDLYEKIDSALGKLNRAELTQEEIAATPVRHRKGNSKYNLPVKEVKAVEKQTKQYYSNTKEVFTNKKNLKVLAGAGIALAATSILIGRSPEFERTIKEGPVGNVDSDIPKSQIPKKESGKRMNVALQSTGYTSPGSISERSKVTVSNKESTDPRVLDRVVYGNSNLAVNRVRQERERF